MTTCHHCGQDMANLSEWHGLRVTSLGDVFWRGIRQGTLPRQPGDILRTLCRRGEATHLSLELLSVRGQSKCISVQICRLRRWLRTWGVPITIRAIHGSGYRLELTDPTGAAE